MSGGNLLAVLFRPYRIWAVASVHAQAQRLAKLHRTIAKRFQIGDRVVYLGNVIGRGTALRETLAELLAFRRAIIAGPGMFGSDVIYLRGAQEEMLQKTLQVQFAAVMPPRCMSSNTARLQFAMTKPSMTIVFRCRSKSSLSDYPTPPRRSNQSQ